MVAFMAWCLWLGVSGIMEWMHPNGRHSTIHPALHLPFLPNPTRSGLRQQRRHQLPVLYRDTLRIPGPETTFDFITLAFLLVPLCGFDVGHEGGEVFNPNIICIARIGITCICHSCLPVEKLDAFEVGVWEMYSEMRAIHWSSQKVTRLMETFILSSIAGSLSWATGLWI